jgi:uncharacterized protein (TIGR02001 family)
LGALQRSALALAAPSLCLGLGFCLGLGLAQPAHAQFSAAVGVQSDYRYRGISLSSGLPAATLDLSYDHSSGIYAGASAIGAVVNGQAESLGFIEYLGYVTPRRGGASFDLGVNNQNLAYYDYRRYPLNYSEVYVGVVGDSLSAHLHYSPNYLQPGYSALYAEVDGSLKPAENWRLFAHLGETVPVGEIEGRHPRFDARAGVARQFGPLELQASVTTTDPGPPRLTPHHRTALVVAASRFF